MNQGAREGRAAHPAGTRSPGQVSTHASARDATLACGSSDRRCGFNPRVRGGRDLGADGGEVGEEVSTTRPARDARCVRFPRNSIIHSFQATASVKNATSGQSRRSDASRGFNPRVREGRAPVRLRGRHVLVQRTRPRGTRLELVKLGAADRAVSTRASRDGRDSTDGLRGYEGEVSIHAREGRDQRVGNEVRRFCIYQPPFGGDVKRSMAGQCEEWAFQPTRSRGKSAGEVSTLASARDATQVSTWAPRWTSFNPRVPQRTRRRSVL